MQCGQRKTSWARPQNRGRYLSRRVKRLQIGLSVLLRPLRMMPFARHAAAYFPSSLKLSQLEDTEFFKQHNPESDSHDGSQTDTDGSNDSDDSSGVDDSNSDNDDKCDMVWAKLGRGVWGLCHVFEDTLYLTHDLMEDSAVPSNLSVPKVSDSDRAATSVHAKKSPEPGEHVQLFRMKRDRTKGFYSEKWKSPSHCALNGLGVLCLGMHYRWFTILSRALNTVSNEHYPFGPYFFWDIIIRWTRGGGTMHMSAFTDASTHCL